MYVDERWKARWGEDSGRERLYPDNAKMGWRSSSGRVSIGASFVGAIVEAMKCTVEAVVVSTLAFDVGAGNAFSHAARC
jgi:hypothetical protein